MDFNSRSSLVKFSTTKYVGNNNESSTIETIDEIEIKSCEEVEELLKNINLFPSKLNDLKGREVALAIFNYMPYTLWMDMVILLFKFTN